MDSYCHEDLNASFSFEEQLFSGDNALDNLCQTYLGNMSSFGESFPQQTTAQSSGSLDEIEAFTRTDIVHWTQEDCLDWAGSVCRKRGIDQSTVDLWSFRNYTGLELLQFTTQDFSNLIGSIYGPLFHQEFSVLCSKREQDQCQGAVGGHGPSLASYEYPTQESSYESNPWELTSEDIKDLDRYIHPKDYDPLTDCLSDMDLQEQFLPIQWEGTQMIPEPVLHTSLGASSSTPDQDPSQQEEAKKKPRSPKNWEFVIGLLIDPKTNPSLIRWEDKTQATFRLVQPTAIAQMWGRRSNKPNLTYDNFARGLRYHYTTGALQAVSEKQLVYKCGPKALKFLIDLKNEGPQ